MGLLVTAERVIRRPREAVAAYAMDPANDPSWIGGISSARVLDGPADGLGSKVERVASFLGRRIEYVNEVVEHEPPARLVMRSVKGPFPMRVTYEFEDLGEATRARIRVEGEAGGFYRVAAPVLAAVVRRSIDGDLERLGRLLESGG